MWVPTSGVKKLTCRLLEPDVGTLQQNILEDAPSVGTRNASHLLSPTQWNLIHDMSILASDVYNKPRVKWELDTIFEWNKVVGLEVPGRGKDHLCLYEWVPDMDRVWDQRLHDWLNNFLAGQSKGLVVLSMSGTNEFHDWLNNFQALDNDTGIFCGLKEVHTGFAKEARSIFYPGSNEEWADMFLARLVDAQAKGHSIFFVGHSLGAAVASLMVACANLREDLRAGNPDRDRIMGPGFHVDGLVTFGAPGISRMDYTVSAWPFGDDEQFFGVRVYNEDDRWVDAVPAASSAFNFKHAKDVLGVAVSRVGRRAEPSEDKTVEEPFFVNNPFRAPNFRLRLPSAELHRTSIYSKRLDLLSESESVEQEEEEEELDIQEHKLDEDLLKGRFFTPDMVAVIDEEDEKEDGIISKAKETISKAKDTMKGWAGRVDDVWDKMDSFW